MVQRQSKSGISQEELGFLAAIHRTEIGMIERGQRIPMLDTVVKIAGALDVSVEELVDGLTWRVPPLPRGSFD